MNVSKSMLLIGLFSLSSFHCNATKLSVQISNYATGSKLTAIFGESEKQEIPIDKTGKGVLNFSNFKTGYVTLMYGPNSRTLWLDPKQDLSLSFDHQSFYKQITFGNSLAAINHYLNARKLPEIEINDAAAKEGSFMAKADSLLKENLQNLHRAKLPESFSKNEENRLKYFTYSGFTYYVDFHPRVAKDSTYVPSKTYLAKVKELCTEDASLLNLSEYKQYITNAIALLAKAEAPEVKSSIDRNISYIEKNITNLAIKEFLISKFLYSHIRRNGPQNLEKHMALFQNNVKDSILVKDMNLLLQKWDKLQVGKPSPELNATDVTGKKVSLTDLKGKFVYIDVWATWCMPCRKELPFLAQIEEKYRGKDIHFVGLSCDANRTVWEKDIAKGGKSGIQIHLVPEATFLDDYMISGIPRFILLDRDGNIINMNMTRPSDPETVKTLDALLN